MTDLPDQPGDAPATAEHDCQSDGSAGQDWITLWQSELAAMAADRELGEMWQLLGACWAAGVQTAATSRNAEPTAARGPDRPRPPGRPAGADEAARPAPVAAASDAGGDEIRRLHARLAILEQRLDEVERQPRSGGGQRHGKARPA